ncbi:hypothetical protein [Azotobacter salinestris]|uniref:hypothetical protein n=1 Tax=Azotobacter salinestris TaxID=69964 RepID=UPI0032DEB616
MKKENGGGDRQRSGWFNKCGVYGGPHLAQFSPAGFCTACRTHGLHWLAKGTSYCARPDAPSIDFFPSLLVSTGSSIRYFQLFRRFAQGAQISCMYKQSRFCESVHSSTVSKPGNYLISERKIFIFSILFRQPAL